MINKNKGLTPLFLYKMIIWLVKKSHENVIFLCSDKNAGSEIKDKKSNSTKGIKCRLLSCLRAKEE